MLKRVSIVTIAAILGAGALLVVSPEPTHDISISLLTAIDRGSIREIPAIFQMTPQYHSYGRSNF